MTNNNGGGFGGGSPPSKCPGEILTVLQNQTLSMQEIRCGLRYKYCPRTIQKWMTALRDTGKIEMIVIAAEGMRNPRYRVKV
jgi:hypothetical protein